MTADPPDLPTELRRADALLRNSLFSDAVSIYLEIATAYRTHGLRAKAIAVLVQVVDIIEASAPELVDERTRALRALFELYTEMGFASDAEHVRGQLH